MDLMKLVESLSPLERKELFDILSQNRYLWTTTVAPNSCCGGCCDTTKYPVTTTPEPATLNDPEIINLLDLYYL